MSVLIIGGDICGLGAALLLACDGHEVTVLERDVGRNTGIIIRYLATLATQGSCSVQAAAHLHARAATHPGEGAAG